MTPGVFAVVLLAAMLHAGWNFAARRVAGDLHVMWRGLWLAAVLSWPCAMLAHRFEPLTSEALPFIIATGIVHVWYFVLLARCYETGDISLVYPVARGSGVAGTAVAAFLLLGEPVTLYGLLGIASICLGTMLLGWSSRRQQGSLRSYLRALGVGGTIAVYSIIDNQAVGRVHPIIYISGMFSFLAIFLTPYMLFYHPPRATPVYRKNTASIVLIGVGSMFTYLLILFAFRLGPVSYVVATRESSVIIAALLGFVFLKEPCTPRKLIAIAAVAIGVTLVKLA